MKPRTITLCVLGFLLLYYAGFVYVWEENHKAKLPTTYPRTDTAMAYVNTTWTDTVMWSDGMRLEGHYYYTDVYSGEDYIGTVYHAYREAGGHGMFDTCDAGLVDKDTSFSY